MGSHPTSKARWKRQKLRRRYARLREDLQLSGDLETVPQGAVRPAVVDPASQGDGGSALLPGLVARALREGWDVPDDAKPGVVDELSAVIDDPETPASAKVAAFDALRRADQAQWERDKT